MPAPEEEHWAVIDEVVGLAEIFAADYVKALSEGDQATATNRIHQLVLCQKKMREGAKRVDLFVQSANVFERASQKEVEN